jgi:shikimate kinase
MSSRRPQDHLGQHQKTMTGKPHRPIVLVGLMGSGKSSVGRILAEKLGVGYWDSDEAIRAGGQSPVLIAREYGEDALHQRESANLIAALHTYPHGVLGAAASVVLDSKVVDALSDAWVVWLRISVAMLADRLAREPGDRPFLSGDIGHVLAEMSRARDPLYAAVADQIVDGDDLTSDEIADRVISAVS